MARHEDDREDLFLAATALSERVELALPNHPALVVAGFRSTGALSLYLSADIVYHFDPEGRLRRAFDENRLYRSAGTTLERLTRRRDADATVLECERLSAPHSAEFLSVAQRRLTDLHLMLAAAGARVTREIPAEAHVARRLAETLARLCDSPLTLAPAIK